MQCDCPRVPSMFINNLQSTAPNNKINLGRGAAAGTELISCLIVCLSGRKRFDSFRFWTLFVRRRIFIGSVRSLIIPSWFCMLRTMMLMMMMTMMMMMMTLSKTHLNPLRVIRSNSIKCQQIPSTSIKHHTIKINQIPSWWCWLFRIWLLWCRIWSLFIIYIYAERWVLWGLII